MRRAASSVTAALLFLAIATIHVHAADLTSSSSDVHRQEQVEASSVDKQTMYLPSSSRFCVNCVNCPQFTNAKERARCYAKFCSKCPNHIILASEEDITATVKGNDIVKLTQNTVTIKGDTVTQGLTVGFVCASKHVDRDSP